jgi:molecular chaperone DnaK
MSQKPVYLGIDLGTTNSTAAVFDGQSVALVRNAQGGNLTPSVVRIDARGSVTVGEKARRFLEGDSLNTRSEFKRLMGTGSELDFPAAKAKKRPEQLSAEVLKSLLADVREQFGVEPSCAVISVPALFELPQSAATSEAAKLAGLSRVELLQEPIASALAAGWTAEHGAGKWLVYDLGGGTFDASLLETRDGFLRVVGHEGDNFLGGRDIDWAIVDWALASLEKAQGVKVSRADSAQAGAVRKLKLAAEEAKIELGRAAETALVLPALLDGISLDLSFDRGMLQSLAAPLVERSIAVCKRLLARHGVGAGELKRVVLVGGPTAMPFLRRMVAEELGAPIGDGLDPMTLVAQGAALFAATAGLDARPARVDDRPSAKLQLHYPAVSSDLRPHVIGRVAERGPGAAPASVRLVRDDGGFSSDEGRLDGEGAFVLSVELLPRKASSFKIEARAADGAAVVVSPSSITIVQGLTITDPPLSRSIGVALANDTVQVYFERGAPLPARRTFVHNTVESVAKGSGECVLRIPMVQGELPRAHLCRLVGSLEIRGTELSSSLPTGSPVEVTLEVDRSGVLRARAQITQLGQVFEGVAHLLVPEASPETLSAGLSSCTERLHALKGEAFRRGDAVAIKRLGASERELEGARADVQAALGGDADAAQKARRSLLEIDAMLDQAELDKSWPEMDERARQQVARAAHWVSLLGTAIEKRYLEESIEGVEKARKAREPAELERQLKVVRDLHTAAYYRDPSAWPAELTWLASRVDSATDLPRARALLAEGQQAAGRNDLAALRAAVEQLWKLLPVDARERSKGYDSGVL